MSNSVPVVFINCSRHPFLDQIISRRKLDETRTRNMLGALVGLRAYLAETGRGPSLCRCSAVIGAPLVARSRKEWNALRSRHRVPRGSAYDWQPWTKVKYLYPLTDVIACDPFHPPEGVRHGRVYMTYNDK